MLTSAPPPLPLPCHATLQPPSDDLTVSDANSAWLAQRYALQPGYVAALKQVFGTEARPLTSADAVNGWVAEATHDKISSIVDDGMIKQVHPLDTTSNVRNQYTPTVPLRNTPHCTLFL